MTKNYIAALVLLLATALPGSAINPYRRYDARTSHKQTHIGRVEYIEQIPQDSDKSKCTVGPEKGSFTLTLQTDSALRKPD